MPTLRPLFFKTTLARSLASGGSETEIYLNSITTKDGHDLVMATDVGDILFLVINPRGANREIVSITGITAGTPPNGTGMVRGYNFYNKTGAVTARLKAHSPGETVIITNDDQFLNTQYVDTDNAQTIAGLKTFSVIPKTTAGNPTDDTELARKAYVDLAVAGVTITNKIAVSGTAGETLVAGDGVYLKESDQRWWKWDADALITAQNVLIGIAQGTGAAAGAITSGVLLRGYQGGLSGLTAGTKYFMSNTAAGISTTPGTLQRFVGIAISTTELLFIPDELPDNLVFDTAGETLAAGYIVYFKEFDQKWWFTDADAAATALGVKIGIAQAAASADALAIIRVAGIDRTKTGLTAGSRYFVSATAGALVITTPGAFARLVGVSLSTQELLMADNDPYALHLWGQEIYAADAVGTDAYAITLPVSPGAYYDGLVINFKAGTANTADATLAVNGLAAITIKKSHDQDLETGDIEANQIVTVVYNSSTAKFQMISQVAAPLTFKNGVSSRAGDAASGSEVIAHGLGRVPKFVRIKAYWGAGNSSIAMSLGVYNGTTVATVWLVFASSTAELSGTDTTNIIVLNNDDSPPDPSQVATIAIDATNITLTWTKTGSTLTQTLHFMWEAEG